jgi:hypothetical protein
MRRGGISRTRGGFVSHGRVEIVARCGALWRGAAWRGIGLEVDLAAELGLEARIFFPAGDGVGIDAQGGGGGGDGVACEKEAGGGELVGVERSCGMLGGLRWVRFAEWGWRLWRGVGFCGAVWRGGLDVRDGRQGGGDGAGQGGVGETIVLLVHEPSLFVLALSGGCRIAGGYSNTALT